MSQNVNISIKAAVDYSEVSCCHDVQKHSILSHQIQCCISQEDDKLETTQDSNRDLSNPHVQGNYTLTGLLTSYINVKIEMLTWTCLQRCASFPFSL